MSRLAAICLLLCSFPLAAQQRERPLPPLRPLPLPLPQAGQGEYSQITLRLPFTSGAKTIWVQKIGHDFVYQGDIVVGNDLPRPLFLGTDDADARWPDGVIPVVIDPSVLNAPEVLEPVYDAMNELMWRTEMRLVPRTTQRDYVRITLGDVISGSAARSPVGRVGGEQRLTIGTGFDGPAGTILHELLHTAGVYHEQSRPDRDYFVFFDLAGLSEKAKSNFDRIEGDIAGTGYDYLSIMHYSADAFAVSAGQRTIHCKNVVVEVPCDPDMGQRREMSQKDIQGLDRLYSEISRFSNGGWDATLTRDLDLASHRGALRGAVRWQAAIGMPLRPNWGNGDVDYVRMSVSSPTREVLRWGNRKKTRMYTAWKPSPTAAAYQALSAAGTERVLRYSMPVPANLPLRVSFETVVGRWGSFPPAPNGCGPLGRCGYGLDATPSAGGALSVDEGGGATIDYRIDGGWSSRPDIEVPHAAVIRVELVKQILDRRDWVKRPIDVLDGVEAPVRLRDEQIRMGPAPERVH